jgi:predicted O-methyltransferase YrrM
MSSEFSSSKPERLLSVIYAGHDSFQKDGYRMRLGLSLNRLAENVDTLDASRRVEILVADWGNDPPLADVLELTEVSRALTRYLEVPGAPGATAPGRGGAVSKAQTVNSAVRRASGKYLLVCEEEVYLPLDTLAELLRHLRRGYVHSYSLDNSFFWASTHLVPDDFFWKAPEQKQQPTMPLDPSLNISTAFWSCFPAPEHLDDYVRDHRAALVHKPVGANKVYTGPGAALLMSRDMWFESTGFDEKVGGQRWDDLEFTRRLLTKYRWDDLNHHGLSFFVLGERPESDDRSASSGLPQASAPSLESKVVSVNPPDWGLSGLDLKWRDGYGLPMEGGAGGTGSENLTRLDETRPPKTVRQIVAANPVFQGVAERFSFLPLTWFGNQHPLRAALEALQPLWVCEIGSYMGASARFFADFPSVAAVYCVDHWDRDRVEGYDPEGASQSFFNNLYAQFLANAVHSGVDDKIVPLRLDSRAAAGYCRRQGLRFDLIYIDGDHTTVGARDDLLRWHPLLKAGGLLCGDDWAWQKEPDNVAGAVTSVAREKAWRVFHAGNFWLVVPGRFDVMPLTLEVLERVIPKPVAAGLYEARALA